MTGSCNLSAKSCKPCEGGAAPLSAEEIAPLLAQLHGWELANRKIVREFRFKDFHQTMAFVNAVAWIAHREDHHPDLEIGYNRCRVSYATHAIGGLSENDFICAAKVEGLLEE